ncbi:MAG: polyprenyl synthetase family protein [Oscillospiraceae bacterium]
MKMFEEVTNECITLINNQLDNYLKLNNNEYDIVLQAMNYSIKAGGKRIRPILTLQTALMFGADINKALPFACAIEMIHCYSLIHDDLPCMDDDDMRRGKPSCHIKFGQANALLAGDALLTKAFEVIGDSTKTFNVSADAAINAVIFLSKFAGVNGMIGGQVLDLENEGKTIDEKTLKLTHSLKTSALLKASCSLGAIAANASEEDLKNAITYGDNLGIAFQITDDILDVYGNEQLLGKPIGSDKSNEKTTYISLYGLEKSKELAKQATDVAVCAISKYSENDYLTKLALSLLNRNN